MEVLVIVLTIHTSEQSAEISSPKACILVARENTSSASQTNRPTIGLAQFSTLRPRVCVCVNSNRDPQIVVSNILARSAGLQSLFAGGTRSFFGPPPNLGGGPLLSAEHPLFQCASTVELSHAPSQVRTKRLSYRTASKTKEIKGPIREGSQLPLLHRLEPRYRPNGDRAAQIALDTMGAAWDGAVRTFELSSGKMEMTCICIATRTNLTSTSSAFFPSSQHCCSSTLQINVLLHQPRWILFVSFCLSLQFG